MGGPKRILHVDDELCLRELIADMLQALGYECVSAKSVREGLEAARAGGFDLVLMDIMMPEIDGVAGCRTFKADPALQALPIIMVSALDSRQDVACSFEAGACDYIIKPVTLALLKRRIEKAIGAAGSPAED